MNRNRLQLILFDEFPIQIGLQLAQAGFEDIRKKYRISLACFKESLYLCRLL